MGKNKVLIVTQEMEPYTALSEIANIAYRLPQHIAEEGMELRILMPRYGTINERRHRLHEVVRLSGMNIIIDDDDYPLIIKVASLPNSRMQVYFLDNDDFFKRKSVFEDADGSPFDDNADRMIFFCKGVLETVKKFGWAPDIIHCHGWMTSLIPLYLKNAYSAEPIFQNAKLIYSAYNQPYEITYKDDFISKATINNLTATDLEPFLDNNRFTLHKGASKHVDGIIIGSETPDESLLKELETVVDKPIVQTTAEDTKLQSYINLYNSFEAAITK